MAEKQTSLTIRAPRNASYPMTVTWCHVAQGIHVAKGDPLFDLKTQNGKDIRVRAPRSGRVASPLHDKGTTILSGMVLVVLGDLDHQTDENDAIPEQGFEDDAQQPPDAGIENATVRQEFRAAAPAAAAPKAPRFPANDETIALKAASDRRDKRQRRAVPLAVYGLIALAIWGGLGGIRLPMSEQAMAFAGGFSESKEYRECLKKKERRDAGAEAAKRDLPEGTSNLEYPIECEKEGDPSTEFRFEITGNSVRAQAEAQATNADPFAPPLYTSGPDFDAAQRAVEEALYGFWKTDDGVLTFDSRKRYVFVKTSTGVKYFDVTVRYSKEHGWYIASPLGETRFFVKIYELEGSILVLTAGDEFFFLHRG